MQPILCLKIQKVALGVQMAEEELDERASFLDVMHETYVGSSLENNATALADAVVSNDYGGRSSSTLGAAGLHPHCVAS